MILRASTLGLVLLATVPAVGQEGRDPQELLGYTYVNAFKGYTLSLSIRSDGAYTIAKAANRKGAERKVTKTSTLPAEHLARLLNLARACDFPNLEDTCCQPTRATDQPELRFRFRSVPKSKTWTVCVEPYRAGAPAAPPALLELGAALNKILWPPGE